MTHRALSSNQVPGEMASSVRPQPIPLLTKVILIGTEDTYNKLIEKDDKFARYFRIAPEFDYTMERNEENIRGTVRYLKASGMNLRQSDDDAYLAMLRYSSWLSEDREKLTTELSLLGDLLEEADLNAASCKRDRITKEDID